MASRGDGLHGLHGRLDPLAALGLAQNFARASCPAGRDGVCQVYPWQGRTSARAVVALPNTLYGIVYRVLVLCVHWVLDDYAGTIQ